MCPVLSIPKMSWKSQYLVPLVWEVSWRKPDLLLFLYQRKCPGKHNTWCPQFRKCPGEHSTWYPFYTSENVLENTILGALSVGSVPENTQPGILFILAKMFWKTQYLVPLVQEVSRRTPDLLPFLQRSVPENIVSPVLSPVTISDSNQHFCIVLTLANVQVLPANISASFFHYHLASSRLNQEIHQDPCFIITEKSAHATSITSHNSIWKCLQSTSNRYPGNQIFTIAPASSANGKHVRIQLGDFSLRPDI